MSDSADFSMEARDLIDQYSQQLVAIEAQLQAQGESDPDLLNGAFRAVHTLKGLGGMVGYKNLEDFCHELERSLDAMRLGKLSLDLSTLDMLFQSVEQCERLLGEAVSGESALPSQPQPVGAVEQPEPLVHKPSPVTSDDQARHTVHVDLRKLDLLMNLVSELALVQANLDDVIARQAEAQANRGNEFIRESRDQMRIMKRRLGLLQHGILEVRMVTLDGVFNTLARAAHTIARREGKDLQISISGADTDLDKRIVEGLDKPLIHMIRNAIDHGIELPAKRVALGKPPAGQIGFAAYQMGNRVVIELTDDGAGMDWRRLRDKAIERGFLGHDEARDITPAQALNLIFRPGFSTRERDTVSSGPTLSGAGVGMDVVKTDIAKLSGMVEVASEPGRGSRFRIILPITLAVIQALVIEAGGQTYCIPLNSVIESIMVQPEDIQTIEGHEVVWVRGRTLPLTRLAQVFELDLEHDPSRRAYDRLYVVVVGLAHHRVGLVVDELLGQQDVVIKPIGKVLRQVPGIAGATELGSNRTVLVIDVATLVGESVDRQ